MDKPITFTKETRQQLLEAIYELDKLSRVLPDLVPLGDDQAHYAVKGVSGRMVRLTNALMSTMWKDDSPSVHLDQVLDFSRSGCA